MSEEKPGDDSFSERIFTVAWPTSDGPIAVYVVADLSEPDLEILRVAVQRQLDVLNRLLGHGPFDFQLVPRDAPSIEALRSRLEESLASARTLAKPISDEHFYGVGLVRHLAIGIADTFRGVRGADAIAVAPGNVDITASEWAFRKDAISEYGKHPAQFLVVDKEQGDTEKMLDARGAKKWGPKKVTWQMRAIHDPDSQDYDDHYQYVYRLPNGQFLAVVERYDVREEFPPDKPYAKRITDAQAAKWLALGCYDVPEDIEYLAAEYRLKTTPCDLPSTRDNDGEVGVADAAVSDDAVAAAVASPIEPSEERRESYHDQDNYRRNVWLYEQRKAGKTNQEILKLLREVASERDFNPLDTENALRTAIDAIADHHGWKRLRGKPGRPPAASHSEPTEDG